MTAELADAALARRTHAADVTVQALRTRRYVIAVARKAAVHPHANLQGHAGQQGQPKATRCQGWIMRIRRKRLICVTVISAAVADCGDMIPNSRSYGVIILE